MTERARTTRPLVVLLALYFFFAFLTWGTWKGHDWYGVTGDEPHYLVMASGIIRHGTFEQTIPYKEEEARRAIYSGDLKEGSVFAGPHGLFNYHGVGLPLLLAVPFGIGGVIGAKIAMILLSGLIVVLAWAISGLFTDDSKIRFWSTAGVAFAMPWIPASNQIYTEIPAGIICLNGMYWLLTNERSRGLAAEILFGLSIAFLPWLHPKLAAPMLILVCGIALESYLHRRNVRRALSVGAICCASAGLFVAYNMYAFGHPTGPFGGLDTPGPGDLMVFLGLLFDQDQGLLLQNPLLLIGLFSIGSLFSRDRLIASVWVLLVLVLMVPNAMYGGAPDYGGLSFVGRYEWSAALVFFVPTLLGLTRLAERRPRWFTGIVVADWLLQLHTFVLYTFIPVNLYNKMNHWMLPVNSEYGVIYTKLAPWMPAFGNVDWAFRYAPNYVFGLLILAIFLVGIRNARTRPSADQLLARS